MLVKQFVDKGLGNSSYLIASEETGQAAVLDPERDVDRYLRAAEGLGLRIIYVLDTHLHNDFISGALEIAAQAGARIGASAEAQVEFEHLPLSDGTALDLGEIKITTLTTPGHTPEHISFTVYEPGNPAPSAVFSGGALIVGGAARTDLLGQELAVPLARKLYHSIQDKLLDLPDDVTLYPTHGAGSFCAAPTSRKRVSTIGHEKLWNPLARKIDEESFVARSLSNLPSYPTYLKYLRVINQRGPALLGGVPILKSLNPEAVLMLTAQGVVILDIRAPKEHIHGHIPGSYCIPLGTPLITWAGWVIPFGSPLVLVSHDAEEQEEAVRQLIRIGYDNLRGTLAGGLGAWEAAGYPISRLNVIPAQELAGRLEQNKAPIILDVRSDAEWHAGHLPKAIHVELGRLPDEDLSLPKDDLKVIHCGHSDRSILGISLLEQRGYRNLVLLEGGYSGWQAAGLGTVREE